MRRSMTEERVVKTGVIAWLENTMMTRSFARSDLKPNLAITVPDREMYRYSSADPGTMTPLICCFQK